MFQALDELRVRDLINPDYEVRYEEVIAAPAMIILTMTLSRGPGAPIAVTASCVIPQCPSSAAGTR
jgi:hypothetical protein